MFSIKAYNKNIKQLRSRYINAITLFELDPKMSHNWENSESTVFTLRQLTKALQAGGYSTYANTRSSTIVPKSVKPKHRKV